MQSFKKLIGGIELENYVNQNVHFFKAGFCLILVKKNRQIGVRRKRTIIYRKKPSYYWLKKKNDGRTFSLIGLFPVSHGSTFPIDIRSFSCAL